MKTSAETFEAPTVVRYSDSVGVPSDVRANLCVEDECSLHGDGEVSCQVPDSWGEVREWANE